MNRYDIYPCKNKDDWLESQAYLFEHGYAWFYFGHELINWVDVDTPQVYLIANNKTKSMTWTTNPEPYKGY